MSVDQKREWLFRTVFLVLGFVIALGFAYGEGTADSFSDLDPEFRKELIGKKFDPNNIKNGILICTSGRSTVLSAMVLYEGSQAQGPTGSDFSADGIKCKLALFAERIGVDQTQ